MPFENVWDKDCRNEVCGYFKPYAWGLQGQLGDKFAMDKDGNSNLEVGLAIAFREREDKKENSKKNFVKIHKNLSSSYHFLYIFQGIHSNWGSHLMLSIIFYLKSEILVFLGKNCTPLII